ncbi:putative sulfate transporter, partial [Trifolium pratense]
VNAPFLKDGKQDSVRIETSKTAEEGIKLPECHSFREDVLVPREEKEISAPKDGVRLPKKVETQADTVKDCRCFLKSYRTKPADVKLASNGVVATIINGEVVPLVQDRIADAGFNDLVLIPMGADKVFLRSLVGTDVLGT